MRVCQFRQDRIFCFCKSERPATILLYTIEKKMQVLFLLFPNIFLFMPNFFSAFLPDTVSFRLFPLLSFFSCAIKQHYEKSKNIYRRREEGKERKGKERKGKEGIAETGSFKSAKNRSLILSFIYTARLKFCLHIRRLRKPGKESGLRLIRHPEHTDPAHRF